MTIINKAALQVAMPRVNNFDVGLKIGASVQQKYKAKYLSTTGCYDPDVNKVYALVNTSDERWASLAP